MSAGRIAAGHAQSVSLVGCTAGMLAAVVELRVLKRALPGVLDWLSITFGVVVLAAPAAALLGALAGLDVHLRLRPTEPGR